jgi:hypothetical protein
LDQGKESKVAGNEQSQGCVLLALRLWNGSSLPYLDLQVVTCAVAL